MTTASRVKNLVRRAAPVAVGTVLLLGSGCGGTSHQTSNSKSPTPANQSAVAAIPAGGAHPSTPAPDLTHQTPTAPVGGVSLEELYQQGKTDTVR